MHPVMPETLWTAGYRGVAAALVGLFLLTACGPQPLLQASTASDVNGLLAKANVGNAHFTFSGSQVGAIGPSSLSGKGVVQFRPATAYTISLAESVPGSSLTKTWDEMEVAGGHYLRFSSRVRWQPLSADQALGDLWLWPKVTSPVLTGTETLPQGPAWHLVGSPSAGIGDDLWVRQTDGYPIRYRLTIPSQQATYQLDFDTFNVSADFAVPVYPKPMSIQGTVGKPMTLNSAIVTIQAVDLHYNNQGAYVPPGGQHLVTVQISSTNTSKFDVYIDPTIWGLFSAIRPAPFRTVPNNNARSPLPTDTLHPGEGTQGWLTFAVPDTAGSLTLRGAIDGDQVTVPIS